MLLTPRTYALAQVADKDRKEPRSSYFLLTCSRKGLLLEQKRARRMLLIHQTGSVKVGEVVRYTLTYTPSEDRILPSPPHLHVRIRNTSAIPLRAAYLHGPYTISVATYPSTFNPNQKLETPKRDGVPEFEPNLKAGGLWNARLTIPADIREAGREPSQPHRNNNKAKSVTWIIEVASQIIFSQSASVNYELLVARDEKSLDLGFTAITGNNYGSPGKVQDHQQGKKAHTSAHPAQLKGIYSKAVKMVVEDTTALWNKPELPGSHSRHRKSKDGHQDTHGEREENSKQKKIHLVIVTHGLHSNLGADMLYLKESIDATARQARENKRKRRQEEKLRSSSKSRAGEHRQENAATAPLSGGQETMSDQDEDEDEEEVVVRGFDRNVIRTERGIQHLGKRLARYVLDLTYPDQPFLPKKKSMGQKISNTFSPTKDRPDGGIPAHAGSSVHHHPHDPSEKRAYKFTSISFIGHSLGGLVQTYAIAYIHKHSPEFFANIKPINFIGMASPFLGLSNENPMYVKFALDFGLVGRTGQDLGLTWRAPTLARSGWTAMVSGLGAQSQKDQTQDNPGAKPLLRILPTGPAHQVLRMFRNRTVYSNVVNDGIVPLRTSCLLFLDWRGLGKVEKARRENGLIGTVAGWGWGQLTGQNTSPNPSRVAFSNDENEGADTPTYNGDATKVPQPAADVTNEDNESRVAAEPAAHQFLDGQKHAPNGRVMTEEPSQSTNTLSTLWNYIRPSGKHTSKDKKMFKRSQTVHVQNTNIETADGSISEALSSEGTEQPRKRAPATRGDSTEDPAHLLAPPKTTIFESAGDLLSPPVPPTSWIIDPSTRARTIFHDRIYHPEDIPPPPAKRPVKFGRSFSSDSTTSSQGTEQTVDEGGTGMRVEEKIARAYHKDLSWRKVLVRLEPDAHNNIVVRRMFANAYGWPVVKHLCDTHFADTYSATTRDENEPGHDRAKTIDKRVTTDGEEVKGQTDLQPPIERTDSEMREVADELAPLNNHGPPHRAPTGDSSHSSVWDDTYFEGTSDEDDDEPDDRNAIQRFLQIPQPRSRSQNKPALPPRPETPEQSGTSEAEIADFLSASPAPLEVHRGLGASAASPTSPTSSRRLPSSPSTHEPDSLESMGAGRFRREGISNTPQTPLGNPNRVGLGMPLGLNTPTSPQEGRGRSGSGVSERIARLSFSKDRS
ncbi:DUF676-domain-containing protein [Delitschia confertaspora ATCC 74209]|uniref:DUF676-domain-containing protein n=1 Tax=Delitschia confertaspora ATCC 74209 TaxID=1513339 RepID=A0A9P4MW23_9PLEO|nr:DUF676-domain-containing protein [Delitschia confertaspora ATCC 74209]